MANYKFHFDKYGNTDGIELKGRGVGVLNNNYSNKGSAFTEEERAALEISGLLPPEIKDIDQQVKNCAVTFDTKVNDFEKFIYIRSIYDMNVTLAHALIKSDIGKYMSIVYTPTVGLACRRFSTMFMQSCGLHFYPGNIDRAEEILRGFERRHIRVAVVTDNQGILGIGDQGTGGLAVCQGKLMLYTQGAGIAPWHCLPISLDVGTDNEKLLTSEYYLGWNHKRLKGDEYLAFVEKFATAFKKVFPDALCQWEDFSKQNAFTVRDSYLDRMISFNDDIQGTGSVTLAGILSAMKIRKEKLEDQIFLIHGAGAGGVGIGEQIEEALVQTGMGVEEARARIFTLDSRGVVTTDRPVEPYKERFAKAPESLTWLSDTCGGTLENVIRHEKVTVLIGTSGQPGCFTEEVVTSMLTHCDRPVILPLSNPTSKTEALPEDIYRWTRGRALVATGSPFDPVEFEGRTCRIGQCNNVFVFPGVGLGVIASGATKVLPSFFTAAAHAVSEFVSAEDLKNGVLFPSVTSLREVSIRVAKEVAKAAIGEGISRPRVFSEFDHENDFDKVCESIDNMAWDPRYLPITAV